MFNFANQTPPTRMNNGVVWCVLLNSLSLMIGNGQRTRTLKLPDMDLSQQGRRDERGGQEKKSRNLQAASNSHRNTYGRRSISWLHQTNIHIVMCMLTFENRYAHALLTWIQAHIYFAVGTSHLLLVQEEHRTRTHQHRKKTCRTFISSLYLKEEKKERGRDKIKV